MLKKINCFILSLLFITVSFAQNDSQSSFSQPRVKDSIFGFRDSLEIFYKEELNRAVDSLLNIYQEKSRNVLRRIDSTENVEIEELKEKIKNIKSQLEQGFKGEKTDRSYKEEKYYDYIEELLDYRDKDKKNIFGITFGGKKINEYKIKILQGYLERYFPDKKSAYVRHYLTQIHSNQNDYSKAETSFIKFVFLYTDSPVFKKLKNNQLELILNNKYYQERTSFIVSKIDSINKEAPFEERYYHFLKTIKNYPTQRVRRFFKKEAYKYLDSPFSKFEPEVNKLLTEYYKNEGYKQYAYLTLKKILAIYPESEVARESLYKKGKMLSEEFGEYQKAIEVYHNYIEQYPKTDYYENAHFAIAKIYDRKLGEYNLAVDEYREFVQEFPESNNTKEAYKRAAKLLEKKIKNRRRAIRIYREIADKYSGQELGQTALIKTGELYYEEELYKRAAEQYLKLSSLNPDDKKIVKYLRKAAEIYEQKLNNTEKAIETLKMITNNYPHSEEAEEARNKLEELRTYGGE